jgi:hypothetical protein
MTSVESKPQSLALLMIEFDYLRNNCKNLADILPRHLKTTDCGARSAPQLMNWVLCILKNCRSKSCSLAEDGVQSSTPSSFIRMASPAHARSSAIVEEFSLELI